MKTLCVIPARGGSKRIPRKNVRNFHGRPMLAWSIGNARNSGLFDRIIVSTDDAEIAAVAREWGAETPFMRPGELADDFAPAQAVIRHALDWFGCHDEAVDFACCLYAPTPLLAPDYLRAGLLALQVDPRLEFAFGVTRFDFPIFRAVRLEAGDRVRMFWPENEMTRSQDLPAAYHDAGQFTWGTREAWLTRERIFSSRSQGIVMPGHLVQDIDTEADWGMAEWKFRARRSAATESTVVPVGEGSR